MRHNPRSTAYVGSISAGLQPSQVQVSNTPKSCRRKSVTDWKILIDGRIKCQYCGWLYAPNPDDPGETEFMCDKHRRGMCRLFRRNPDLLRERQEPQAVFALPDDPWGEHWLY